MSWWTDTRDTALGIAASPVVAINKGIAQGIDYAGKGLGIWGGPDEMSAEDKLAQAAAGLSAAQLEEQRRTRDMAMASSAPTAEELSAISKNLSQFEQMVNFQDKELNRMTQMLNAIDPGIMELSKQIVSGIRGESKSPYAQQINRQRGQLQADIQTEQGTTTGVAAQKALGAFDEQAAQREQQYQAGQLNLLGGLQQQRLARTGALLSGAQTVGTMGANIFGMENQLANRKTSAIMGTSLTPYVGGQYAGAMLGAQAQLKSESETKAGWFGLGGSLLGAGAKKALG